MTLSKRILIALVAVLAVFGSASAQFRFGIKAGVDINKMSFDKSAVTDSKNRTGFTGGLMTEFTVPIIGLCFDASLMYTHKVNNATQVTTDANGNAVSANKNYNTDFLSLPINLKYKFGLPIVGNFVAPYIFTGPQFNFLMGKKEVKDFIKNKTCDINWNVGIGVQLLSHVQISAGYGFGINSAAKIIDGNVGGGKKVKNNCWTVTAAYLF